MVKGLHSIEGLRVIDYPEMRFFTTFRIGGRAIALVDVCNEEQLDTVIARCEDGNLPWRILGRGSNILVRDRGFDGVVIRLRGTFVRLKRLDTHRIEVGAGASLQKMVRFCLKEGLGGCEFLVGVPGTIGGAVLINAGCFGGEIGSLVDKILLRDEHGFLKWKNREDLVFAYRYSSLKSERAVVIKVIFRLFLESEEHSRKMIRVFSSLRRTSQPLDWPSAGSIFRNPPGGYAARLIEEMGFKGVRLGRARVSPKHSNFIVNLGGATASQVENLMEWIRREVYREKNVWLENEVEIWR